MTILKSLIVRDTPCINGDSVFMADKTGQGVIYSSEPDSIIMMHCAFLTSGNNLVFSEKTRINLFVEKPNVSNHSSLISHAKKEYNAIFTRVESLGLPLFNFVNSTSEADIVIKIDTIHKKHNKVRRRFIRTKWFPTETADQVWIKGVKEFKKLNIALYTLRINGKSDGLRFSTGYGSVLNSSGFLTECAYLMTLKSALITL